MWQKRYINFSKIPYGYWAMWCSIWLLLMGIAYVQNDIEGAARQITPKLLSVAIGIRFAFRIKDIVHSPIGQYTGIIAVIFIIAIICIVLDVSEQPFEQVVIQEFVNTITMVCMAFALRYGMTALRAKQVTYKAELLRKLAEQRAINARLTPHVLYNMLNAIYAASLKDAAIASQLILSLANMMRHLTDSTDKDFVDAQSELNFMRSYAELTRVQMNSDKSIQLDFPDEVDTQIPNLLCVTLFENAVTHSKSIVNSPQIEAYFEETPNGFTFCISNVFEQSEVDNESTHTGIDSVRQRLAYLYSERHRFSSGPVSEHLYQAKIEVW